MEQQVKPTDSHLRSILSSPIKLTPAVPVTDWSAPAPASAPATVVSSTIASYTTSAPVC